MNLKEKFDEETLNNLNSWLDSDLDPQLRKEINRLIESNPQEIINAFYKKLTFGTGGLRGVTGLGTTRMNRYTIRVATQGLANYIKRYGQNHPSVCIGYDCRVSSPEFAHEAAIVLAGNGLRVHLFNELRPTPLISFACRKLQCTAAIMITASHNPPEYNGYKVYWADGGQVLPPHDEGIIDEVNKIKKIGNVSMSQSGIEDPLIAWIGEEMDEAYLEAIKPLQHYPEEDGNQLKIVYSNLHGTGITLMPEALKQWGFGNISYVEDQKEPDGTFPTVQVANPELASAMERGIATLEKIDGDILIATDPDADRVGVAVRHHNEPLLINGNQISCLCLEYICEALTQQNKMPERGAFIKTIATTELFKEIANAYGKPCFDVLTGFKYIAGVIKQWEDDPEGYEYIFGGEESYGYLLGTKVRDKDGILSSALICEVALHAKLQGKTLIDKLHDIYRKYGTFIETLLSVHFEESKEGREKMTTGIASLENHPPKKIHGIEVEVIENYKNSVRTNLTTGEKTQIHLPKNNALLFWLKDGSKLLVRPSGTEPKIKIYCGVSEKDGSIDACRKKADGLSKSLHDLIV